MGFLRSNSLFTVLDFQRCSELNQRTYTQNYPWVPKGGEIMSRKLQLVNLSDWDGEDYKIRRRMKKWIPNPGEYVSNPHGVWEETQIKPGESPRFDVDIFDYEIIPVDSKVSKPFRLNGERVFLEIAVYLT